MTRDCVFVCSLLAASCEDDLSGFKFAVVVSVGSDIDAATLDGSDVPIVNRQVNVATTYADYTTAMAAAPLELEFFSSAGSAYVGRARAGACQTVCEQLRCPDLSKFRSETITETSPDFVVGEYVCVTCEGPTNRGLVSCP